MADRSDLAMRMKSNYEHRYRYFLTRRTPVAIRIDGKAFHTFTAGFKTPFDEVLITSMQETMKYLCEHIQGCVLGYHQSDEITLILIDYQSLHSDAWFDYNLAKMTSISASMATAAFNDRFRYNASKYVRNSTIFEYGHNEDERKYIKTLNDAIGQYAMFDSRVFNIPKEEVTNLILWRQQDASRNSVEMVGRSYFSDRQLHKVNNKGIQDMLFTQYGVNWNDFPTHQKRGSCCIKEEYMIDSDGNEYSLGEYNDGIERTIRSRWIIDKEIPIFTAEGRDYIEKLINI